MIVSSFGRYGRVGYLVDGLGCVAASSRLRLVYFGVLGPVFGMVRVIPAAAASSRRSSVVRRRWPGGGAVGGSGMQVLARSWRVRLVAWPMVVRSTPSRAPVMSAVR